MGRRRGTGARGSVGSALEIGAKKQDAPRRNAPDCAARGSAKRGRDSAHGVWHGNVRLMFCGNIQLEISKRREIWLENCGPRCVTCTRKPTRDFLHSSAASFRLRMDGSLCARCVRKADKLVPIERAVRQFLLCENDLARLWSHVDTRRTSEVYPLHVVRVTSHPSANIA